MITLPTSSIAGIEIPHTDLISKSVAYLNKFNTPPTIHHSIRSAIWALIIRSKVPSFEDIEPESVVVATLLHDLGWSNSPEIRSPDKRFEIDGANAARDFVAANSEAWDKAQLQALWDSIALHSSQSIALHGQPIVHLVSWSIGADFYGPSTPGDVIKIEEYEEVLKAYPRIGFKDELGEIFCGLCRDKPETTYDNLVGDFGLDAIEGYHEEWEKRRKDRVLRAALEANEQYEK